MNKAIALAIATGLGASMIQPASPAEASIFPVTWDKSIVEVVNKLPSDWPVGVSVRWLDQYTASSFKVVSKCSGTARRCVTIKQGRLTGSKNNNTGWSQGETITIDTWKAKNVKPWKGKFGYYTKKYLIVHELAHQRFLEHSSSCHNVMNPYFRCNGHVPDLKLTASQKKVLAKY